MSKEVWWAPNATTLGYATKRVVPGSVVMYTYNDDGSAPWELGRVLGEVLVDGCGELYDSTTLLVLEADRRMHHCYERHIPLKWIKEAYDPTKEHAKFAAWFLSPDFLKPGLNLIGFLLGDAFLDGIRGVVYERLGLLQTQRRKLAHSLNDLTFVRADAGKNHVELGLLRLG